MRSLLRLPCAAALAVLGGCTATDDVSAESETQTDDAQSDTDDGFDGPDASSGTDSGDPPDDLPSEDVECDYWLQDCGAGQKCQPYERDGALAWNATKCVQAGPRTTGKGCSVSSDYSDNCDDQSLCVDAFVGQGTCFGFCGGTPLAPSCQPDHFCHLFPSHYGICRPSCDPLPLGASTCPVGTECLPAASGPAGLLPDGIAGFSCFPTGDSILGRGSACDLIWSNSPPECESGLACIPNNLNQSVSKVGATCRQLCEVGGTGQSCPPESPTCQQLVNIPAEYSSLGVCSN